MLNRRSFLGRGGLVAAAGGAVIGAPHIARSAEKLIASRPGQKPTRIIHLVADGMSMGTLTMADQLSHILRKRGLSWVSLFSNPAAVNSLMNMRSLNSLVTDSSAAASSWGSGSRIINGAVNQLPDGRDLKTLYELFAGAGWKRGLVTTTEITHATPAGFAANADSRDTGSIIARQYLERKIDVLLGGGTKFFDPAKRRDKRDLRKDFLLAGYSVMETAIELQKAPLGTRWLGTFASSHLPFSLDHMNDGKLKATVPTLAEMTTRALDWFRRHDKFILQVEGGRVDHGCHNCDAPAALRDMIAFDEALDVCLAFQKQFPDTLLVITTDHANGNPGLNGIGKAYGQSSWLFENTAKVKCSFSELLKLLRRTQKYDKDGKLTFDSFKDTAVEEIKDEVKDEKGDVKTDDTPKEDDAPNTVDKKPDEKDKKNEPKKPREVTTVVPEREMQEILKLKWGYSGSTRRIGLVRTFLEKKGSAIFEVMNGDVQALGQLMANHTGISFTGNVHTGDYVVLTALGPGSERFRGFVQNTDVFHHYLHYAGIQFRNPEEEIIADGRFPEASEVESPGQYA